MRLIVDLNRCQGMAQCVFLAPDVFELHGDEAIHYDPNPALDQQLRVLRAAVACPLQAIMLDQLDEAEPGGAARTGGLRRPDESCVPGADITGRHRHRSGADRHHSLDRHRARLFRPHGGNEPDR